MLKGPLASLERHDRPACEGRSGSERSTEPGSSAKTVASQPVVGYRIRSRTAKKEILVILSSSTIVDFFVRITSVFVTPLMTVYLMGVLTPVNRRSGLVGLIAGAIYGLAASNLGGSADAPGLLPFWFIERFAAYSWSMGITAAAMLAASLLWGWTKDAQQVIRPSGWRADSRETLPEMVASPFAVRGRRVPWWAKPVLSAALLITASGIMVFGVLW